MEQQNHTFIDTENCASSVGYYIRINDYTPKDKPTEYSISGTVVLADCSHKIDWSFGDDSLDKIDTAIGMMQEFRKKYVEMAKHVAKLKKNA